MKTILNYLFQSNNKPKQFFYYDREDIVITEQSNKIIQKLKEKQYAGLKIEINGKKYKLTEI
jgi:hypothetical protein